MRPFAFDKSVRRIDADGRLHVELTNISKATVNPYRGDEIPNSQALGLDPNKVYMLLRDPKELEKAAPTFNGIPLLSVHIQVSAKNPEKDSVVGTTGTDAVFEAPYLKNSLSIWDAQAIAGVETKEQCEISCAYRYVADMTPGEYEGASYDGVMREIVGNHVALVDVGRAGPDVLVADRDPFKEMDMKKVSGKTIAVRAALKAMLRPTLAVDASLKDLNKLIGTVTTKTMAADTARIVAAFKTAKIACDEDMVKAAVESANDESEEEAHKDEVEGGEKANRELDKDHPDREGEDDVGGGFVLDRILKILEGKVPDDVLEQIKAAAKAPAEDESEEEDHEDDVNGGEKANKTLEKERKAMDAAIKLAQDQTIARMNAIADARETVYPIVGKLGAMDSAEGVYKFALDQMGVDVKDVHPSAYRALVLAHTPKPKMAADSGDSDFWKHFPGARLPVRS